MPERAKPFEYLSLDAFQKLTMRQKREYLDAFKNHLEATGDPPRSPQPPPRDFPLLDPSGD